MTNAPNGPNTRNATNTAKGRNALNAPGGAPKAGRAEFMVRALKHRNYRLFFAGQGTSLIGTWITRLATSWLVYRLTGSAAMLGIVGFAGQIPTFFLAPFAGVWVDRLNRYRVLLATQILAMVQSLALAALALTGTIQIWHIVALIVFQGLINAFDMPARQAFVVEMVENRDDLPNAIALNSSMVNGARLLGPSIAGVLIAATNEGVCFLIDGISYIAVIASLLLMRVSKSKRARSERRVWGDLSEGFRYAFGSLPIRYVLGLLGLVSLMGVPYTILMPVIATDVLHGGPNTLGFLMGATGVGALAGAVYLASRPSVLGLGRIIAASAFTFGFGLVAFSRSRSLSVSLLLLLIVGAGFMVQMAASNTVIQTIVREDMRGRVMSLYTTAFMGTAPFGSLLAGFLAGHIGAANTILFGGIACMIGGLAFARALPSLRVHVRPIYIERGILQAATEV